ncbi:hypothetical protein HK096_006102, partial [Nowakowskiella sp. JEL0078]
VQDANNRESKGAPFVFKKYMLGDREPDFLFLHCNQNRHVFQCLEAIRLKIHAEIIAP